jgi:hypothetical protein
VEYGKKSYERAPAIDRASLPLRCRSQSTIGSLEFALLIERLAHEAQPFRWDVIPRYRKCVARDKYLHGCDVFHLQECKLKWMLGAFGGGTPLIPLPCSHPR